MHNKLQDVEILEPSDSAPEAGLADEQSRLSGAVFWLLCLMPLFAGVAYGAADAWAFGLLSLLAGAIAVLWLSDGWRRREFRFHTSPLQIPLLGLIAVGLIQLLPLRSPALPEGALLVPAAAALSLNPYATRMAVAQLIVFFVFLAASLTFIDSARRMRRIVAIVVIFGGAMAFFGILQWLADPESIYGLRTSSQAAPFGSFVNRHHFAALMEMTIGLTLALLIGKGTKKDKRLLLILAVVLMGLAIVFTGSRGGMLSLFGVLGFVLVANLLHREKNGAEAQSDRRADFRRKLALIGGGVALVVVLFGSALLLGGESWLARGLGLTSQTDISSGRLHFWSIALQVFRDYPLLGAGLDSFGTVFTSYDSWNGTFRIEQAHNDYLQIMADAGISGLICVLGFIYFLFRKGLRVIGSEQSHFRRSVAVGSLAGCFGILLHSFFDFPLRTPANGFFFLLLAVLATATIHFPRHHRRKQ